MPDLDFGPEGNQVAAQTQWLQALVESVPDGLCLLDGQRRLLFANRAGSNLLQLLLPDPRVRQSSETAPLGEASPLGETAPQAELPQEPIAALAGIPLATLLDGELHEISLEQPTAQRIGVTAYVVAAEPAAQASGGPAWALLLRDITESRRQSEFSRQQERLAAVGQLAAGVAHDFNNILSSIVLYTQLLGGEPQLSDAGQRRLQVIQEQTRRASELVRQLLDFSRRSVMQRAEVDLVPLCYELVEGWRRSLAATIDITFHHHAPRYIVHGDASRLQQALLNLALNAQEAMPRGGRFILSLSHRHIGPNDTVPQLGMEPGLWLQMTIADTGAGIAPEALPHVFEPFFSTKPLHEGAGLGLAQVHGIVHQHGGHVKIDSETNRGTIVTIYLPLEPESTALPAHDAGSNWPAVLVVEHDDRLRKALGDALQRPVARLEHRLFLTGNGQEALALVRREKLRPALIIGDLALAQMSGLALLQAMRAQNRDCRMIIVSNYPVPANSANLRAAGIAAWLPKPFSMSDLLQQIERLLAPDPASQARKKAGS